MNNYLKIAGAALLIFAVGAATGRFLAPSKVVEKEHIVYQDKVVEKKVEDKDTKKKNNKVYIKTVTVNKDGTSTTTTKIMDKSQTDIADNSTTDKTEDKSKVTDKLKEVTYSNQSTIISLGVRSSLTLATPNYGVEVQKRLIGPLYIGGSIYSDKTYGLTGGIAF